MGRVFACGDLHGRYDLFKKVKEFLKEDDICYILGDMIDRGDDSIAIVLDVMTDKRFKALRGNHEQMMTEALDMQDEGYVDFQLWYMNGGEKTHYELMKYPEHTQILVRHFCRKLPLIEVYGDVIMSHAGFDWALKEVDEEILLWSRSHISSESTPIKGKLQVHGHTPVHKPVIKKQKICIDTGAFYTGVLTLLDLDKIEVIQFTEEC